MILEVTFKEINHEMDAVFGEAVLFTPRDAVKYDTKEGNAVHTGEYTEAGWRSLSAGYMTIADNTSFAAGRLAQATGKGSFAVGLESYTDVMDEEGNPAQTAEPFHIDDKVVSVVGVGLGLGVGDVVAFSPTDAVTGFVTTDVKRIVDLREGKKFVHVSTVYAYYCHKGEFMCDLDVIHEGDYVSFAGDKSGAKYLVTEVLVQEEMDDTIWFDGNYEPEEGEEVYVHKASPVTILELNAPFRAGNYYEGYNCPEDGFIPSGASVRQAIITKASGGGSHAEGGATKSSGAFSHAEGYFSSASADCSHAEGNRTEAVGNYAHAEGSQTKATGHASHSEGVLSVASGDYSHTEGHKTVASGDYSHAQGKESVASGGYGHAEGYKTEASGTCSHTEGSQAKASGEYAHAEGLHTLASSKAQHAQGKYNVEDKAGKYAHIVGNGTSLSKRSNCHTIDWSGNAWFAGGLTLGNVDILAYLAELENRIKSLEQK